MLAGMWRKRNPPALLVGTPIGANTVESSMELPQKIKNGTALWLSNSASEDLSKVTKTLIQTNVCSPMFIAVLLTVAKIWKPKCPSVDEWIKQLCDIYTKEYYQP